MTTIIEDSQLNTELQELYLITKHWIDDLEFFEQDMNFLQRLFMKTFSGTKLHEGDETSRIMEAIVVLETQRVEIKTKIVNYLHVLEPLINGTDASYQISLIETHSVLEREMNTMLQSFKAIKKAVFQYSSHDLKAEKLIHNNKL